MNVLMGVDSGGLLRVPCHIVAWQCVHVQKYYNMMCARDR